MALRVHPGTQGGKEQALEDVESQGFQEHSRKSCRKSWQDRHSWVGSFHNRSRVSLSSPDRREAVIYKIFLLNSMVPSQSRLKSSCMDAWESPRSEGYSYLLQELPYAPLTQGILRIQEMGVTRHVLPPTEQTLQTYLVFQSPYVIHGKESALYRNSRTHDLSIHYQNVSNRET